MPWVTEELSDKPIIQTEEPFIISTSHSGNNFLMEMAEAFNGGKSTPSQEPSKRVSFEKLELAYRLDEIVARCVNFYALQVIGPKFDLINCQENTKKFLMEFIDRTNFMEKLEDVFRDVCKYGNGWLEKKFNVEGKFVDIDYVNGKYMDLQRNSNGFVEEDQFGNIIGYVYKKYDGTFNDYPTEKFAHFKMFGQGNELAYGFIEPMYLLVHDKLNARNGISQAGWRAGNELLIAYVGDKPDSRIGYPGHKADKDTAEHLSDELEDIKGKHKLVLPNWVKMEKIPSETIDWSPLMNYFDSRICAGFGVPNELIYGATGARGGSKATLETSVVRDLDRRIKTMQNKITSVIRDSIFMQLKKQGDIDEIPDIRWLDITPADLNRLAKRLLEYKNAGLITEEDMLSLKKIIFEQEGFTVDTKLQQLTDFVITEHHISVEEAVAFLSRLKISFPEQTLNKMIDSLIEKIMMKTTGQQIPQESGGMDKVQDGSQIEDDSNAKGI